MLHAREPGYQVFSQVLDAKGQWSTAVPITLPGQAANYTSLSTIGTSAGSAFAARYDATEGWLEPAKLGPSHAEDFGPGAALDDAGNALAVWPNGSKVSWKRSSHATLEWLDGEALDNQDPMWATFATAAASGEVIVVWQNQLGVWTSRFE